MHIARAAAPLVGLALILGACSSGAGTTTPPTAAATAAPTEAPASAPGTTGGVTIDLASSSLGAILVDGDGMTLYVFTPDTGGTSTCTGSCASTWPPLTSDATPTVGSGLNAADFGTTTRDDGSTQITFHDMPLYHFGGDSAPGDTNGQGVGGKWYVVGADGSMIGAGGGASAAPTSTPASINY